MDGGQARSGWAMVPGTTPAQAQSQRGAEPQVLSVSETFVCHHLVKPFQSVTSKIYSGAGLLLKEGTKTL